MTRTTTFIAVCAALVAPGALACQQDPQAGTSASTPNTVVGRWYRLELPTGGIEADNVDSKSEIDAIYGLDKTATAALSVMRPMPRQPTLDAWATALASIMPAPRVAPDAIASVDGVPALVRTTDKTLDWIFVADGFGGLVRCGGKDPHAPAWLHATCDPVMRTFKLVHPIAGHD